MPGPCGHLLFPMCGCAGAPSAASHQDALPAPQTIVQEIGETELFQRFDAWSDEVRKSHSDSWSSVLTGIGTRSHDKREQASFQARRLSYPEAIELWRGDAMAARIIELLPASCFAKGYDLVVREGAVDQDFLDDVNDRMGELKVDDVLEKAYQYERAYGGSAILMGIDDGGAYDEPLIIERARSLDSLTLMEPLEIYPATYYTDMSSPKYGMPEYYRQQAFTVSGAGTVIGVTDKRAPNPTNMLIHESRLIVFAGISVSRYQRNDTMMGPLWGDSILIRIIEALRDYNIAWASAGILTTDFSTAVISIENLMSIVAKHPQKLAERMRATTMMQSNARAMLIDKNEKYQRESTNLAGLAEVMDRLSQRLASDGDIPLSMLITGSPEGLGQPGQNDVVMFQDRTRTAQRRRMTSPVKLLAKTVMQTLRKRKLPKRIDVEWRNLVHQSDKDIAETQLTQARVDNLNIKSGMITPDEARKSRYGGRFSLETHVSKGKAPGFIAPLPAGVMPKAMSGEAVIQSEEAGNKKGAEPTATPKAAPTAGAHPVSTFMRRNPQKAPTSEEMPQSHKDAGGDGPGAQRNFAGLPVIVESPKGSVRNWTDTDGTPGTTTMNHDYGYLPGVNGADGDSVDVYLGPNENAANAYIVHQMKKPDFAQWDEDKVMLGFPHPQAAKKAYLAQFNDPRFYGGMTPMPMRQFRTEYLGAALGPAFAPPGDAAGSQVPSGGREEITGGYNEQLSGQDVEKPLTGKPERDPLWNSRLTTEEDDEA